MDYKDAVFRDCEVELDGNSFTDCTFERVTFVFSGGKSSLVGCAFHGDFRWRLDGPLSSGLQTLHKMHHLAGPKAVKGLVDSFTRYFRSPLPKETFTIR